MNIFKIFFACLWLMFPGSTSELPVYHDDEQEKKIKQLTMKNKELEKAYNEVNQRKKGWIQRMVDENYLSPNREQTYQLGSMYSTKDFFVKKVNQSDIQVKGQTSNTFFYPIEKKEMKRMSKKYRTVHLDGFYINCESLMPAGSEGFAILSLYDVRFIDLTKGFLGMIGFPLAKRVGSATLRLNYPISTSEQNNWVAIITVYNHNLKDDCKPCNFHIKTFYKYTNNLDRFSETDTTNEVGKFKIPITADPDGFALESVRNSLDYSVSVLSNAHFLNNLSRTEINSLNAINRRWESMSQREIPISDVEGINKIDKGKKKVKEDIIDFGRASTSEINELTVSHDEKTLSVPGLTRSFSTHD